MKINHKEALFDSRLFLISYLTPLFIYLIGKIMIDFIFKSKNVMF